jgi:hypothetical protein
MREDCCAARLKSGAEVRSGEVSQIGRTRTKRDAAEYARVDGELVAWHLPAVTPVWLGRVAPCAPTEDPSWVRSLSTQRQRCRASAGSRGHSIGSLSGMHEIMGLCPQGARIAGTELRLSLTT